MSGEYGSGSSWRRDRVGIVPGASSHGGIGPIPGIQVGLAPGEV